MNYRIGDDVGPDYMCSRCGAERRRLWRQAQVFLENIKLLCAECALEDQADNIERLRKYNTTSRNDALSITIGHLVAARATPDGTSFWGHTSGDVEWWYRLSHWKDSVQEREQLRLERDHFVLMEQHALRDFLEVLRELREANAKNAKLKAACEAVVNQLTPSPSYETVILPGQMPLAVRLCREALE